MRSYFKYFLGSTLFAIFALLAAFFVGFTFGKTLEAGWAGLLTALILGVLETSLSFDNAVVNARILQKMSPFWRKMFLTLGIVIAVFGMRIVFPILIVWAVSSQGLWEVFSMTWKMPEKFQQILVDQHVLIDGFGGTFLSLVFLKFFLDEKKKTHWIGGVEEFLSRLGRLPAFEIGLTILAILGISSILPVTVQSPFIQSSLWGLVVFIFVEGLGQILHSETGVTRTSAAGIAAFLYLETLDASFSFDGVIGAFAITDNLFLIALGLGIGAFFVRSLTIKMVDTGSLKEIVYLEHGAFWAIGALAAILYFGAAGVEVPEILSGSVGMILIVLSFISSLAHKKKNTPS
jgi:hypothetical protein